MDLPCDRLFCVPARCSLLLVRLTPEDTLSLADLFPSSPIPEITDADMAFQATETHANADIKPFRKQYRLFHAAFAQFCYTGAQVGIAGFVSHS